jgi:hypothetical protein
MINVRKMVDFRFFTNRFALHANLTTLIHKGVWPRNRNNGQIVGMDRRYLYSAVSLRLKSPALVSVGGKIFWL